MKVKKNSSFVERPLKKLHILIAAALYLIGLLLGSAFTLGVPFFKHRSDLLMMAQIRGEYTLTHFVDFPNATFGTEFYLIRADGEIVTSEQRFLSNSDRDKLADYLPELLEKGQLYTIQRCVLGNMGEKSGKVFCIIAGSLVESKAGLKFGSIIVRDLNDVDVALETFIGIYTFLFAVAFSLLIYIARQNAALLQLQRDLVSNVSHELKTPISSIKALAELLYDEMYKTDEERKHYIFSILSESDRLKDLVKEILELAKLQNHKVELKKEKCHADEVLAPTVDRYKMLCGDLGIDLDTSGLVLEDIPALYTDAKYITKVLNILLENAVKFVGTGGKIALSAQLHPRHAVFCVKDNGPGIDKDRISRIFERFYKADEARNSNGSGLGLSIAAETMKGLGEQIWVESTKGVGSSFYFTVGYKK